MTVEPRQPQAVPQAAAVDSDERDDGPNPVGIMLILGAVMVIFWVGAVVGFISALQVRLP
jgi:hypothetical protein